MSKGMQPGGPKRAFPPYVVIGVLVVLIPCAVVFAVENGSLNGRLMPRTAAAYVLVADVILFAMTRLWFSKGDRGWMWEMGVRRPVWLSPTAAQLGTTGSGAPWKDRWRAPLLRALRCFGVLIIPLGIAAVAYASVRGGDYSASVNPPWMGDLARATSALELVYVAGLLLLCEFILTRGDCTRAIWLIAIAALVAGPLLAISYGGECDACRSVIYGVSLVGTSIGAVVALGWLIDPNAVALHAFYRARLVRAYLGASNVRRNAEVTETVPGDDVSLREVRNFELGAPHHLVNTTLNLVGGRDLGAAQRSAAPFVLSSIVCGSGRTGYRRTAEYMQGSLTLGTAIAASGAAVSPNMGARTQSAALSLLMGLFNVRLGIWVPNPGKARWMDPQTRLWPFYLLRESLSQTNALGQYTYLTDGGHFENTGLYALVERACRNIIVIDAGEDHEPNFDDIGNAVRLCRIDFGAEVNFPAGFERFGAAKDKGETEVHVAQGTIRYSRAHLEWLGFDRRIVAEAASEDRTKPHGTVLWIKPVVAKGDPVDLRQFHLERPPFPQDTTKDQWFTEQQFESYRSLGALSIACLVDEMRNARQGAAKTTTPPVGIGSDHDPEAVFGPGFDGMVTIDDVWADAVRPA
jgi:hypothetical protein